MGINPGDECRITRDIVIGGQTAFSLDEIVTVEKVDSNLLRPGSKYVVTSQYTGTKYQLSDADIAPREAPQSPPIETTAAPSRRWPWIVIPAVAALVLVLVAGALYFVFFRTKTVPNVMGLSKRVAEQRITSAGFKTSWTCKYPILTGSEKVVWQEPKAGVKDRKVDTVKIVISDPEMESAILQAQQAVGQANDALREVQALGIDTTDLVGPIQNAQAKLDGARSIADCVGPTDSAGFWAGTVINSCNAKKQAFLSQQERNSQIANCRSTMLSYARANSASGLSISFSSFSINSDCTAATAWLSGTMPSGQYIGIVRIQAVRRGDSWVITDFGTG